MTEQLRIKSLNEIGVECGTDKSALTHCYLDNYEKYLAPLRDKEFVLLELGVSTGASIKMWRQYFSKAKIYGIDNNPDCAGEGIFIGSQTDTYFLDKVLAEIGTPLVCIDDCSHEGKLTIETFKYLFPKIADGGMAFIEDCATFYNIHYSGEFEVNGRSKVYNFFTDLAYHVDIAGRGMTGNRDYALSVENPIFDAVPEYSRILDSIHIHPSLWLFKRR